jgi:hypothetical protein
VHVKHGRGIDFQPHRRLDVMRQSFFISLLNFSPSRPEILVLDETEESF